MKKVNVNEYAQGLIKANGLHCAVEIAKRGVLHSSPESEKDMPKVTQEASPFAGKGKKTPREIALNQRRVNHSFWTHVLGVLNKSLKKKSE